MPGVLGQDRVHVPLAGDQHPVGALGSGGAEKPFRESVHARAARGDLHSFDPGVLQDCVKGRGELPGLVTDQEPEPRGAVTEVHRQVPDLLGSPRPVRVRGHSEDVHLPGADLDHDEAVQPLERDGALDMEEIAADHRGGLRSQELPPCGVGVPLRRGRYLSLLEDPADAGGADLVAQLEQLALDPLVSPGGVLGGEPPTRARTAALTGRRPVRFGYVHFLATSR
jgi:hypothetical protein